MASSPLPDRYIGRFRNEQGWIGGTSPLDAAFVPPPPEMVPRLVEDLVTFVNRTVFRRSCSQPSATRNLRPSILSGMGTVGLAGSWSVGFSVTGE